MVVADGIVESLKYGDKLQSGDRILYPIELKIKTSLGVSELRGYKETREGKEDKYYGTIESSGFYKALNKISEGDKIQVTYTGLNSNEIIYIDK